MRELLNTSLGASVLPSSGVIGSGVWSVEALCDCDITVEGGSVASLVILDVEGSSAEINIDVARGAVLNILHVVKHRSASSVVPHDAGCHLGLRHTCCSEPCRSRGTL